MFAVLALMTVAAATFGVLYAISPSSDDLAVANAATESERDTRRQAEDARNDAEDRASAAEDERDATTATVKDLQACQQAAKDLLTALNGDPNAPATTEAATNALNQMATTCQ